MKKVWKSIRGVLTRRPVVMCMVLALLLNLLLEMLGSRSVFLGLRFLFVHPVIFIYNALIIMLTLSVALFFSFRRPLLLTISSVWIGLGVANSVLMKFRSTPLSAIDFKVLQSAYSIIGIYLTPLQMVLIGVAVLCVAAGVVVMFVKAPRSRPQYKKVVPALILTAGFVLMPVNTVIKAEDMTSKYESITDTYANYGFACCFTYSIFNTGIEQPEEYNRQEVFNILEGLNVASNNHPQEQPNIVLVQLESFFDPAYIKGVTYSEDPVPVFRQLKEQCSTGFLRVPVVGGGTANTEFEVLSGMSLEFFGIGEYPYKTAIADQPCESVSFDLKELGYTAHALHNNTGTFYDRNKVYANLGFDTFTSSEYMRDIERNPLGWIKDKVLAGEIEKALQSTPGRDFVYAVSVQLHGKYPEGPVYEDPPIRVQGVESQEMENSLTYYVNEVREVDAFVGELVQRLADAPEPTVLVFYGDHLPCLDLEESELETGDLYQAEYVIWSNFGLLKEDKDVDAFQLTAEVMGRLGMNNGILTKLHQQQAGTQEYKQNLKVLQYDMLFGGKYSYIGRKAPKATDLKMGLEELSISAVTNDTAYVYIHGAGFTPWSVVKSGTRQWEDTEYLSPSLLRIEAQPKEVKGSIIVEQVSDNKTVLSESVPFRYT